MDIIISVFGGLALFLYGMTLMSDGLKETAGERMKTVLRYMTRNRFFAILAGTVVTGIIQSSSATTVITVGFVNAGLLSLTQAIGVIFGANIGTTVTGQIVSLKLDELALPSVTLGVIGLMIARRTVARGIWRTVLGFGLLFFGMTMMADSLKTLSSNPTFLSFFSRFDCTPGADGYLPLLPLLGALAVGLICTMIVQSSSATIGITIALAETGVIPIWTAIPIVLGDNIGTTITAVLAAIGGNANARRTALAHSLFNILGTIFVFMSFIFVATNAAGEAAPAFFHLVNASSHGDAFAGENLGRHVAMAHSIFNVANVCILSFFIPQLARLCSWIISDDRKHRILPLEPNLLLTPELALVAARMSLADMTRRSSTIASVALNNCLGRGKVSEVTVENAEQQIDEMRSNLRDYIVAISQRRLTERQAAILPVLVHCINDAERISDVALKIHRRAARVQQQGLSPELLESMQETISSLRAFALTTTRALRKGESSEDVAQWVKGVKDTTQALAKKFGTAWEGENPNAPKSIAFLSVISAIKDVARHLGNIAERIPQLV
jgi:phosphate:Na+ symporter